MTHSETLSFLQHRVPYSRQTHLVPGKLAIVLSCLYITAVSTQDGKIECTVPLVKPLQEAVLICHFPEDLSVTKKSFSVYHYAKDGSQDAVIDCWWLNNKLECHDKPGFKSSKTVGANMTVTIREVTSEVTGKYACQVDGYGPKSPGACELKFELGSSDTCSIVQNRFQANITCFFTEDIAKTRRRFAVYKHNGQEKHMVANCSWEDARPGCQVEHGYLNSDDVSYYTTFRILEVAKDQWGNYSCWHEGSTPGQQETCQLYVNDNETLAAKVIETDNTLAIVLGSVISTFLLVAGIVLLMVFKGKIPFLRRRSYQRNREPNGEESSLMTTPHDTSVEGITKKFMQRLVDDVKEMYPKILDTCHFVPPVYFNKTRYKTHSVANNVVYIPVIPDIKNAQDMSILRHDMAMQHVLHCLRHMADQRQEKMFVLTQFDYDDYLNNPGTDYQQHGLPVPSGVVDEEDDVACVDFVIVHREHGVLVGVVKAVSDEVEDSDDGQQDEGGCIITAVTEAVQQLQKANRVIRHVMSDQRHCPSVRQTLILPNLTRASLGRAVSKHTDLVERLRECLDVTATEDPTNQCLCVEDLSHPTTPWLVKSDVVNTLRDRWKWTWARVDDIVMTVDLYLTVIARFCGPATQSTLDIQDQPYLLPKTLAEAVSLTGDLYERWTLHPDMVDMLNEQRLFLVGPPGHQKTRMLTVAAETWLSRGHQVYILSDSTEPTDSAMSMLWNKLKTSGDPDGAGDPSRGHLSVVQCDLKDKNEVEKTLEKLNVKEINSFCVIVQDIVVNRLFRSFCETLRRRSPDVYLWATCNTNKNLPEGWTVKTFIPALTCPPAVVREVSNVAASQVTPGGEGKPTCLPPTDGPPVKYFNHVKARQWTVHECKECSKEVADFLIKHLLTRNNVNVSPAHDVSATNTQTTPGHTSTTLNRASTLQKKDVFVLFESDVDKMYQFLTGLKECGIAVSTLQYVNGKYEFTGQHDSVRAMYVDQLRWYQVRKKVVVYVEHHRTSPYVEHHRSPGDVSKKQLVINTCTSQLIVIRGNP